MHALETVSYFVGQIFTPACVSACLPLLYPSILLLLVEPHRTYLGWEIAETCWSGITSKWMCGFIWEIACTNSEVAPFRRVMIFTLFDTLSHLFSHAPPSTPPPPWSFPHRWKITINEIKIFWFKYVLFPTPRFGLYVLWLVGNF